MPQAAAPQKSKVKSKPTSPAVLLGLGAADLRELVGKTREAIDRGDHAALGALFEQGAPLEWGAGMGSRGGHEACPLERCARKGSAPCFETTLEAMDIAGDEPPMDLLTWAASSSNAQILSLSIAALEKSTGRDAAEWIDARLPSMPEGSTAFLVAAGRDNPDCAEMLLDLGADASSVNEHGQGALELAARAGCEPMVKLLAEHCDAGHRNAEGQTPLMAAIEARFGGGISILAPRSDPLARDAKGRTCMLLAACDKDAPLGALEALATGMSSSAARERVLAEVAAAMGAATAMGNEEGAALLSEIVESVALKIELRETLPTGAAPPVQKRL